MSYVPEFSCGLCMSYSLLLPLRVSAMLSLYRTIASVLLSQPMCISLCAFCLTLLAFIWINLFVLACLSVCLPVCLRLAVCFPSFLYCYVCWYFRLVHHHE